MVSSSSSNLPDAAMRFLVHQPRMVGDLAQAQQPLQDFDAAFVQALIFEHAEQHPPVQVARAVIQLALSRLHVAIQSAFGARRQLGRHLVFGAAQDERVDQSCAGFRPPGRRASFRSAGQTRF